MAAAERIEIPMNEAGMRCFEIFSQIAMRQLNRAREATEKFMAEHMPKAEIVDEHAIDGKYVAVISLPNGTRQTLAYDYCTRVAEIV